ncbi:hypothetical protein K2173_022876 [Erythroxylum novogranatense]|uniref:RING-type E3 ubiquitin transferase n=1 Tax=Erythroxylum novogranatense TaxID=1862640 RepID=A0AAV8TXS2_9ROSI|nr:hypothetical protein K2173_022876 [Erythroxylum novogranatense]
MELELIKPVHPLHPNMGREPISELSSIGGLQFGFRRTVSSKLEDIVEERNSSGGGEKVYVAVGKSVEKAVSLLQWVLKRYRSLEICILHVHQPSHVIPTLLGKLPASQANQEVLTAYRREEREQTRSLLDEYLSIFHRAKVQASIISIESDQVQKGIIDLVKKNGVRKLVMGDIPENKICCKNVPLFCEILFVNKGKHIWTREASDVSNSSVECGPTSGASTNALRSKSVRYSSSKLPLNPELLRSNSSTSVTCYGFSNWIQNRSTLDDIPISLSLSRCSSRYFLHFQNSKCNNTNSFCTTAERRVSSVSDKMVEESLYIWLTETRIHVAVSRNEAFEEFLKRQKLELEAVEIINKVKIFESAYALEVNLRKEAEDVLSNIIQEGEKLLEEREENSKELQRTMRNIAFLDSRAQEANRRCDEASGELKLIQASIASLQQEKHRIRRQKMEALHWLERWRSRGQDRAASCNDFIGIIDELPELAEFSLADLQTATCNFSDSFKLGQGGYGCVYKGEMLGRTVAIKQLHPHNMQGQSEFHKEVQVLGKLQHPHLVTLLGACPEAWSLVYEYLPSGSLHDRLFTKSNIPPLTWKIRSRIIAEISSALCFLHSSKPEKVVHGDLKPQNIFLDSELSCKICEFGICRLVTEDTLYCPSFRTTTEPKGAFPYTDPEFQRIGVLTPKSDIYSFGVIILQLLTGRPPVGLVGEVRRTVSRGKLASILDPSAGDWPIFVARRLVDLGLHFCELNSRNRPELTAALVRELEQLHLSEERPVPSFFLCPIFQEIMHDPNVAADGFTYEGEAIRGWLDNGRETSPMTNLKLSHLNLTPNRALRLAIQDWLCKS